MERRFVMKRVNIPGATSLLLLIVSLAACGGGSDRKALLTGVFIQDGSVDLVSGTFSVPVVYDWNSDGKKDILVGHKDVNSNGHISFYENTGTDSSPSFNGSTLIMSCNAQCSPLNVTAGG
jgi:hypothetical protein